MMRNSDPERRIFLSAPNNYDRFSSLHTFRAPAFGFNVRVAVNESHSFILTSAILKTDVLCDVAMTPTPKVLTTELHDLLHNQCIDNMCRYSFFIRPTSRIRVCKIKFVSAENLAWYASVYLSYIPLSDPWDR